MLASEVKNVYDTVVWLLECELATIEYMAGLKRRNKAEFERHKEIAQQGFDFLKEIIGADFCNISTSDMLKDIIDNDLSVDDWILPNTVKRSRK